MSSGTTAVCRVKAPALAEPGDASSALEPDWARLPRAALWAWTVDSGIGLAIFLAVLGALHVIGHPAVLQRWLLPLAGLGLALALVECLVVLPRRRGRYRYALDRGCVVVESGALVRRQLVVPLAQVIYVETRTGPVLKAYGLTHVQLGTIADAKSVGPLSPAAAAVLRRAVEHGEPAARRPDVP